jgi:hypothetical protein
MATDDRGTTRTSDRRIGAGLTLLLALLVALVLAANGLLP